MILWHLVYGRTSTQQYPTQSSKSPNSTEPCPSDNFQMNSGSSSTENLIESLTNSLAPPHQSTKSHHLPQTKQSTKSFINARTKSMVQDGKVVVQDIRGRYNATNQGRPFQRNNARGNGVAGNVGAPNRGGMINPGQSDFKIQTKLQGQMLLKCIAQENGAFLDEEQSFVLARGTADECDAFDSDVDEGPMTQTMFMASLTSEDPIYDEAGPSYDSNNPLEFMMMQRTYFKNRKGIPKSQLKYHILQERFDNKKSQASPEAPDFRSFFKIKNLEHQIQEKDNVIGHLKDIVTNVKARSREPYSAVDVTASVVQSLDALQRKNRTLPEKKENKKEVEIPSVSSWHQFVHDMIGQNYEVSPISCSPRSFQIQIMLWHRRFNHLNLARINYDLLEKDLVRRPNARLKFEKDQLAQPVNLEKQEEEDISHRTQNLKTTKYGSSSYPSHGSVRTNERSRDIKGKNYPS
ncbi:hypothetical protein Tco_1315520 [Tanacetum coccineum]